jgi:hypothetical protein
MEKNKYDVKIHETKKGHKYLKTDHTQLVIKLNSLGICDRCGGSLLEGVNLVACLNMALCNYCFDSWSKTAQYYKEDAIYEQFKIKEWATTLEG